MGRAKAKLPDRWECYSSVGRRIPDTRFICCKCPLKEELCRKLPSKDLWFTPEYLFRHLAESNLQIGLLIDLTNTDRYYDNASITYAGVEYEKIFTPGHDVPGQDAIDRFAQIIERYEKKYSNKDLLIAVHCTHGVNRTGYQVCHYLIETLGWTFEKAVQAFNHSRGHSIERENYLQALKDLERNHQKNGCRESSRSGANKRKRARAKSTSSSSSSTSATDEESHPVVATVLPKPTPAIPPEQHQQQQFPQPMPPVVPPANMYQQITFMQQMMMGVAQMQAMFNQMQNTLQQPQPPQPSPSPVATASTSNVEKKDDAVDDKDEETSSGSISSEDEETPETSNNDNSNSAGGSRPGWELGGKVDGSAKTAGEKRRLRKKRLRQMHLTMQRGKFWEIREMQKERYGF